MTAAWLDGAVAQVLNVLSQRGPGSTKDVYVWSDGSVTGPRDNTDRNVEELRVVGVFSASESPTEQQVRETLVRGMSEARDSETDERHAVAAGRRPAQLPGTPPSPGA